MLDTSIEGQVHGVLSKAELEFLESSLQSSRDDTEIEHCLICLHHNPIPASADWMQDIGLQNDEEFFEILERFDKVNCAIINTFLKLVFPRIFIEEGPLSAVTGSILEKYAAGTIPANTPVTMANMIKEIIIIVVTNITLRITIII